MTLDLMGFADPWEHIRLLSDRPRNEAMLRLLERHARGARVLEVGCGTGLLSCVAARLGASRVYAVEPTPLVEVAEQLVVDNGLGDVVEVLLGEVGDLEPRPVDLAFSELLNADPFAERVIPAMQDAASWVVPGGRVAPIRLRVMVALTRASGSALEARDAGRELARLARTYDLRLGAAEELLQSAETYRYFTEAEEPATPVAVAWDIPLGVPDESPEVVDVTITAPEAMVVGGALVWFEATLDEGLLLGNAPGASTHWGRLVCAWPQERALRAGQEVRLTLSRADDEVDVTFAG